MYTAKIVRLQNLRPHSNADRLQVGEAAGLSCIVDLETKEGDLGIVFPEGGAILRCFAEPLSLYRKHPDTQEPMGGYLDPTGRVRALKLRGEVSMGLWMPIDSLAVLASGPGFTREIAESLEDTELTEFNGHTICEKYLTPATRRALQNGTAGQKKLARKAQALPKHYDTGQLRDFHHVVEPGTTVVITEKLHGTSGRTGHVKVEQPMGVLKRAWNFLSPKKLNLGPKVRWEHVSGTRNCIVADGASGEKGQEYRVEIHGLLERAQLAIDEQWFYEVVGFTDSGQAIMAEHQVGSLGDTKLEKEIRKTYGDSFHYTYGCSKEGVLNWRVLVYRITDLEYELTYDEIVCRVDEINYRLGSKIFEVVPLLHRISLPEDGQGMSAQELRETADRWTRGSSILDSRHPREGVCVRFETPQDNFECPVAVSRALKHKSWLFCALEGIKKNDESYVDQEEVS